MKKQQVLQHIFSFVTASMACAAILMGNPATPSPASGGIGQETEEGTGTGFQPEIENPWGGDSAGSGTENSQQNDDLEPEAVLLE